MKDKYGLEKNIRGYDIAFIKDQLVRFAIRELASKLMRKFHLNYIRTVVIELVQKRVESVQIKLDTFLLNEFLSNCCDMQEKVSPFHYLILMDMVAYVYSSKEGS